jgi:hypothetical protein
VSTSSLVNPKNHVLLLVAKTLNASTNQRAVTILMLALKTLVMMKLDARMFKLAVMIMILAPLINAIQQLDVSTPRSTVMTRINVPSIPVLKENVFILLKIVMMITNVPLKNATLQVVSAFTLIFQLNLLMYVLLEVAMLRKELSIPLLIAKIETNAPSIIAILKKDAKQFLNSFLKIVLLNLQDVKEMLSVFIISV